MSLQVEGVQSRTRLRLILSIPQAFVGDENKISDSANRKPRSQYIAHPVL
jgi:hypothetical protein